MRATGPVLATVAAAMLLMGAAPQPAGSIPELSAEQWQQDLDFMVAEMERRHANLYHSVLRERFQSAVADLRARIPDLPRNRIIVGMMRIAAMVGDGHTRVDARKDARFGFASLPLKLYLFEDGLFIRAARPEHANHIGARIEAIGGVPVAEAIRRASELASRDNAIGPRLFVPIYLNMPDVLEALGLSDTTDRATFRLSRGGRAWTATITSASVDPLWPPDTDISLVTPEGWVNACKQAPLWLQKPLDYHRLIDLPASKAVYAQLNMVTNIEGQTLADFGRRIRERAAASDPRTIILDLRLNQGGNGDLRHGFVRELIKTEDADTRLAVLTWRGTFSASQFILDDLDRLTDAVFLGEPASSRPTSYSDAYRTPLPNSGISVRTSIAYWQDEQNRAPWTWVDVAVPYSFADYATCRDPVLDAALAYVPPPPLQDGLIAAFNGGGTEALAAAINAFRHDPKNRYANVELQLLRAARALSASEPVVAVEVARLTSVAHPQSADSFSVLAQLAETAGQKAEALAAGRRVLELDPNNRFARSLVERLEAPGS